MMPEKKIGALGLTGRGRWLIQTARGELFLVDSEAKVRELIEQGRMTTESCVHELTGRPRALADVPELARLLPDAEASEPPIRGDRRSPERAQLSEELAILNRPLEDEVEYYEDLPRSRLRPAIAVLAVLALIGGGGYLALVHGHGAAALARALSAGAPAAPPGPAVAATSRPASIVPSTALAVPAPVPAPAPIPPTAPAAPEGDPPAPSPAASAAVPAHETKRSPPTHSSKPGKDLIAAADRLLENGRTRQAEDLYRQVLREQPEDTAALTGLAYTRLDKGRIAEAISLFKEALARDRKHAPALFGLGEAYREQGKRGLAVEAFKQYLELKPSGRDADMARRQIRELSS